MSNCSLFYLRENTGGLHVWGHLDNSETASLHLNNKKVVNILTYTSNMLFWRGFIYRISQIPLYIYCLWSIILPFLSYNLHRRLPRNRNDLLLASNCLKLSILLFTLYLGLPYCLLHIIFYSYFNLQIEETFLSGLYS